MLEYVCVCALNIAGSYIVRGPTMAGNSCLRYGKLTNHCNALHLKIKLFQRKFE